MPSAASANDRARDGEVIPGSYIVEFAPTVTDADAATTRREQRGGFQARFRYGHAIRGFAARLDDRQLAQLRTDPEVVAITPNRRVQAVGEVPPGVQRVRAHTGGSSAGSGVPVAVIDTGVDLDHPDLNVVAGKNCVGGGAPDDDNGHGTHVAGTIAARADGGGVLGVVPGATVYAVKVLDSGGSGSWSQVICGVDWVAANRSRVAVANMSLGGGGTSTDNQPCGQGTSALHQSICNTTAAGVRIAVAAGNSGWEFPHPSYPDVPAAYPEVVTVTAMGDTDGTAGGTGANPNCRTGERDDRYASFSNYSNNAADNAHTVAAPGVCVASTWPGGGYNTISGTSMAAPHVAGVISLCVARGGCAGSASSIATAIAPPERTWGYGGDPFSPLTGRYYGYIAQVTGGSTAPAPPPPPPDAAFTLTASPSSRTIAAGASTTYTIAVAGDDGFTGSVSLTASGLPKGARASFSPSSVTAGGSSTLTITTRRQTPVGAHTVTVTGASGGTVRTVSLTLHVT